MRQRLGMGFLTLAFILGAGCAGEPGTQDEDGPETTAVPTTAPTTSTTAADTTTTEPTTTTTAAAIAGCSDADMSGDIVELTSHELDLDADGAADTLTVFFDESNSNHGLLAEYATGGSARLDRPIFAVRQALAPFGLFDVNDDGTPELFVVEYPVEDGINYEPGTFNRIILVGLEECALTTTTDVVAPDDRIGKVFSVSVHPPQGGQLRCEDGAVFHSDFYRDASSDSSAFSVSVNRYILEDNQWTFDRDNVGLDDVPKDEMLGRPLVDCGDLELPAPIPPA